MLDSIGNDSLARSVRGGCRAASGPVAAAAAAQTAQIAYRTREIVTSTI
jgi:hypothetical protein